MLAGGVVVDGGRQSPPQSQGLFGLLAKAKASNQQAAPVQIIRPQAIKAVSIMTSFIQAVL